MPFGSERAGKLQIRFGLTVGDAEGINTERDAIAIKPEQFTSLINVDHKANRIKNRDGLAKVNSSAAMTGSVLGLADDRVMGTGGGVTNGVGRRWYYIGTLGLNSYDPSLGTPLELLTDTAYAVSTAPAFMFFDDGWVYFANASLDSGNTYLYRFRPGVIVGPSDTVASVQAPPEKLTIIDADANTATHLASMCKAGPYYYIGSGHMVATDIVSTATVYRWDGKTLTQEDTRSITELGDFAILATYRDRPVVMYGSGVHSTEPVCKYKADSGTWTALTWPTAGVGFYVNATCEFKDKLWWAGHESDTANAGQLYSLDGTTITKEREITTTLTQNAGFTGMVAYDGYLYFLYYKDATGVYLGRYDGTTWTNEYKLITATPTTSGPLWIQGGKMWAGTDGRVYAAALGSLSGSWSLETTLTVTLAQSNGNFSLNGAHQVVVPV